MEVEALVRREKEKASLTATCLNLRPPHQAMTQALALGLPDFTKPFVIQTDASSYGMGDVLLQDGHRISYFSKIFCLKLQNSSTYFRELHSITLVVKKWRHYLLGQHN